MTVYHTHQSPGSDIVFEKTPEKINPLLTPSLTLRCSLHDSTPPTGSGGLVGRRDVTHTDDNIRFLMSLVVTRNDGEHVASVTQLTPSRGLVDAGNLHVTGDINTGHEELGYLKLVWVYPDASQAGTYSCEVNGMTSQGHGVVFSQTAEVVVTQPSLADLVQHIHDQELKIVEMKQEMEASRLDLSAELNTTKMELQSTTKELNDVKVQLDKARHIENGTLKCGDSRQWTEDSSTSKTVTGTFTKVYEKAPIVHIGVVENKVANHDSFNSWYEVTLVNVGNDSFTIKCSLKGGWYNSVSGLSVDWVSFSNI